MSEQIRRRLKGMTGEFTALSFNGSGIKSVAASLMKMERRGEIVCIRRDSKKTVSGTPIGAPVKVYIVVKLKEYAWKTEDFKPRSKEGSNSKKARTPETIKNWMSIFPAWFKLPDFKINCRKCHDLRKEMITDED